METASGLTLHLADAIGLYLLAIGLGGLIDPTRWRLMIEEMERSPGLTILMGVVAFAIGVAMLGIHHGLSDPLAIAVTIIGAAAAGEGLALLAAPRLLIAVSRPFLARPRLWAGAAIVLGATLLALGLTGRAHPIS